MISYPAVIAQIRTVLSQTFKAVAGGVSFESLDVSQNTPLPAAFVVPLTLEAEPNMLAGGNLKQYCTETFGVIVVIPTGDLRGQQASLAVPTFRTALWSALLNWRLDNVYAPQGLYYAGDDFLHYDSGRTFWVFRFSLGIQISELDGYQVPTVPLTNINVNFGDPYTDIVASSPNLDQ